MRFWICAFSSLILLELFKVAFCRLAMFGLGTRLTSGQYAPTYNIHLKTRLAGGKTNHAYPDPDYFTRCLDELYANNVVFKEF